MARNGGGGSHRWEVQGTLDGYFWACSCGTSSGPVYPSEDHAASAVENHRLDTPPAGTAVK